MKELLNFVAKFLPNKQNEGTLTAVGVAVSAVIAIGVLWLFRNHLTGLAGVLWPVVIGLAILGFHRQLAALVDRIKSVGTSGVEFHEARAAAQAWSAPVGEALKRIAPTEHVPAYLARHIEGLKQELDSFKLEKREDVEQLLLLRLAEQQDIRGFFWFWILAYASQIEALLMMNNAETPIPLSPFYDAYVSRIQSVSTDERPIQALPFERWANFFEQSPRPEECFANIKDGLGQITERGSRLMRYAAQSNLPRTQIF